MSASWPTLFGWLRWAARLLLTAAFLLSGVTKVLDPGAFAASLLNSPLALFAPLQPWLPPLAFYLPWLEIFLALGLWFHPTRLPSLFALATLLAAFSLYLGAMAVLGLDVPCGCFGDLLPFDSPTWSLLRNFVLIACVFFALPPRANQPASATKFQSPEN